MFQIPDLVTRLQPAFLTYLDRMRSFAIEPCIPTRGAKVPSGPDWIHEIKHDGFRLMRVQPPSCEIGSVEKRPQWLR